MTVKELMAKLEKMNPSDQVFVNAHFGFIGEQGGHNEELLIELVEEAPDTVHLTTEPFFIQK